MSDPEHIASVVREWVAKAEDDFTAATRLLATEEGCPTDAVCFHAQQCVEKYLKALLTRLAIPFPKTHDIEGLLALVPEGQRPDIGARERARLTTYATNGRYPGDYEPTTLADAKDAVKQAKRARAEIRRQLPDSALKRSDA